jgi:hypothetical protein
VQHTHKVMPYHTRMYLCVYIQGLYQLPTRAHFPPRIARVLQAEPSLAITKKATRTLSSTTVTLHLFSQLFCQAPSCSDRLLSPHLLTWPSSIRLPVLSGRSLPSAAWQTVKG